MRPEAIPPIDTDTGNWRVIVETPRGSANKYTYDPVLGMYTLSRVLPEGLCFPLDFGFLPSTLGDDGDPVDVLLLMDHSAFPGCLVEARLVGVIQVQQTEEDGKRNRNDRLLGVSLESRRFAQVKSLRDIGKGMLKEVEDFFTVYNREAGKKFVVTGHGGSVRAKTLAKHGMKKFNDKSQGL